MRTKLIVGLDLPNYRQILSLLLKRNKIKNLYVKIYIYYILSNYLILF
jgi:orotidine-5'-phosphate decarboxylase